MISRAAVVAEAREWIGSRWSHQCSLKGVAADCIGLIGGVGVALGLPSALEWSRDPQMRGYGPIPNPGMLLAAVAKYLDPAPNAYGLGDILLLRFDQEPHHFAIVSNLSPTRVIHAYASARKVCETPIDGEWRHGVPWRSLILSAWRYKELTD